MESRHFRETEFTRLRMAANESRLQPALSISYPRLLSFSNLFMGISAERMP